MSQLAVLPILIPLIGAPLIAFCRNGYWAWNLALGCSLASLISCFLLLQQPLWIYAMGGWSAPVGIEYRIDAANQVILLLVAAAGFLALLASHPKHLPGLKAPRLALFYVLFSLCLCGLSGIAATADAFNVFVFLEISSLATYALVASGHERQALKAAFQYLILGTIAGSFVLLGIGYLYMATGSLNMQDIALRLPNSPIEKAAIGAAAFLFTGFALKTAIFPLHGWLPGVYRYAPVSVAALLSATGTKVSLYALMRFALAIFGVQWLQEHSVDQILLALSLAAMLVGGLAACQQQNLRYLLAWSSISQIGYLLLGFSLLNLAGLQASYLHLLVHALIKGGLFLACVWLLFRFGADQLDSLRGLGYRDPVLATAITIGGLGLIGVPLTAGFISKWYLLLACLEAELWLGLIGLALSSVLALVYAGRFIMPLWQKEEPETTEALPSVDFRLRAVVLICAIASIVFGLWPAALVDLSGQAAAALLGAGA